MHFPCQGYRVAIWLRRKLGKSNSEGVKPSVFLGQWKVPVDNFDMPDSILDAFACWGPRHGPAIFVNKAQQSTEVRVAASVNVVVTTLSSAYEVSTELVCWQVINSDAYATLTDDERNWLQARAQREVFADAWRQGCIVDGSPE
jgi:hypothetical protein